MSQDNLVERLYEACAGHPFAKVAWPHRLLHEAADRIAALERERVDKADAWDAIAEKNAKIAGLKAEVERLREALTPSGDTKAAYMGEFTIAVERYVNEDEEPDDETEGAPDPYEHIMVPWTTIKEIMAAIRTRASQSAEVTP